MAKVRSSNAELAAIACAWRLTDTSPCPVTSPLPDPPERVPLAEAAAVYFSPAREGWLFWKEMPVFSERRELEQIHTHFVKKQMLFEQERWGRCVPMKCDEPPSYDGGSWVQAAW